MGWLEARFKEARPRAIAALNRQFRDIDLAEEAFSDACVKALSTWPRNGLPKDPFAWLLTTSRNAGIDRIRKNRRLVATPAENQLEQADQTEDQEDIQIEELDNNGLRDDVLRLLFICCHPALKKQDQLALALKIVAGMSVEEIARAFLIKSKTMEKRLTRAKQTISTNPVPFDTPDLKERAHRLNEVSLMVYLMFNEGWSTSASETQYKLALCEEAIRLARLLLSLFPGMSEQMGLLALLLFQHSRRDARLDAGGHLVALDRQDRSQWDRAMIAEAVILLQKAARHGRPGSYQLQAAIAQTHAVAETPAAVDWQRLEQLYAALYQLVPTPVVRLNQITVLAKSRGPRAALDLLDPLENDLAQYRWFHTAKASFLEELGEFSRASACYRTALLLQPTEPERQVLEEKITLCEKNLGSLSDSGFR